MSLPASQVRRDGLSRAINSRPEVPGAGTVTTRPGDSSSLLSDSELLTAVSALGHTGRHTCIRSELAATARAGDIDAPDHGYRPRVLVLSTSLYDIPGLGVGGNGSRRVTVRSLPVRPPRGPSYSYCPDVGAGDPGLSGCVMLELLSRTCRRPRPRRGALLTTHRVSELGSRPPKPGSNGALKPEPSANPRRLGLVVLPATHILHVVADTGQNPAYSGHRVSGGIVVHGYSQARGTACNGLCHRDLH